MKEKDEHNTQIQSEIISGLHVHFYKQIHHSLEKDNKDALREIFRFVLKKIADSVHNKSLPVFIQLMQIPTWVYDESVKKFQSHQVFFRDETTLFLKTLIQFNISAESKISKTEKEKKYINEFIFYSYQGYLTLLYKMIFNKQSADIEIVLERFSKIKEDNERIPFRTRLDIRDLRKDKNTVSKAIELEEQLNLDNYASAIHFQSSFAIQAWLWYLYSLKELDKERLKIYSSKLNLRYDNIEDLLNDVVVINDRSYYGYLGLSSWDYIARPEMEVYSPPQPHEWLTKGLTIYMLSSSQASNIDMSLIPNDREFYFIYGRVKEAIQFIKADFEKWKNIISCTNLEEFEERSRMVYSIFNQLRRRYISIEEQEIASQSISTVLIENFQKLVYNAWLKSSKIKSLFEHFKNIDKISDNNAKFKDYSFDTFFAKAKTMFTDKNYQRIYGVEDMGGQFGRRLDNEFLKIILATQDVKPYSSVTMAINDFIKGLKSEKHFPDLIFMPPEFIVIEELKKDPKFTPRWQIKGELLNNDVIGLYDNIPIISTYSALMSNKVIVCSFKEAFHFEISQDDGFSGKELNITVNEVNQERAQKKLNQEREKWTKDDDGNVLTEEEAITLIKTSVIIKIAIKANFIVKNSTAYLVAEIDKNTIDSIGI